MPYGSEAAAGEKRKREDAPGSSCRRVKLWNCADSFNDEAVWQMIGSDLAEQVDRGEGLTWAVKPDTLQFAGFGWLLFRTAAAAQRALAFDALRERSTEARLLNGGRDLFVALHPPELPDGRCGWCGKEGHFARECDKKERPLPPMQRYPR
ncbi:hypothetical protein DIPPA_21200 [Diplonema papillatum]|nr:hypothetical protein DIPPA_21200 [Diplonema papillatum]